MQLFRIAFIALFLFPVLSLQAQEFRSGLIAGVSATQVDGDNLSGYSKLGPHLGIFVERSFGERWSLRTEFLFTIKGAKNYVDIDNITDPFKSSFYYIEVPLLLSYRIKKFQLEAGPSFGVLLYAFNNDKSGRYVTTDRYNRLEWAAHLGLTYQIKQNLLIYSRYSYSLNCIDGNNCGSLFTSPKRRAGYFHNIISVGIRKYFRS